jgi:asparagine synthase (glutamine-hydrolysing)
MSGLAVTMNLGGGPAREESLLRMLEAIPHRALDGCFFRICGEVGLGFARMALTRREVDETQPLESPRTACLIVADARLDNRPQLIDQLGGASLDTDAELILKGYERWGVGVAERLLGDFAFMIWDPREMRLLCARDGFGQRTLFYRENGREFAAASELHQLLQDPEVEIEANSEAIEGALVPLTASMNTKDQHATHYRGIYTVPAGHTLTVTRREVRLQAYWRLERPAPLRYRRDEDYIEHFRELLFQAVADRLADAPRVTALLSGGLDSSSVVTVAQQILQRSEQPVPFSTVSGLFAGLECDETEYIRATVQKYELAAHYVPGDTLFRLMEVAPTGFSEMPGLRQSASANPLWTQVCRTGARTLLTGDVADACAYGSRLVLDSLIRRGRWGACYRHLRALRRTSTQSLKTTLVLWVALPLLPISAQKRLMCAYKERGLRNSMGRMVPKWIPGPLERRLSEQHISVSLAAERDRRFQNASQESDYRMLWPPEIARNPSGLPLQLSRPYVDRRLVEFLLAIPPDLKFEPRSDTDSFYAGAKQLIRKGLVGVLPEAVRTRPEKTVFSSALTNEVTQGWGDLERVFGPNGDSECVSREYVDRPAFFEALLGLKAGRDSKDQIFIARILMLETWLRNLRQPRSALTHSGSFVAPAPRPVHIGCSRSPVIASAAQS